MHLLAADDALAEQHVSRGLALPQRQPGECGRLIMGELVIADVAAWLAGLARTAQRSRHRQHMAGGRPVHRLLRSLRPIPVTDARDGTAPLVADDAVAAGRRAGGRYVAVCGVEILAASLATPERTHCRSCTRTAR